MLLILDTLLAWEPVFKHIKLTTVEKMHRLNLARVHKEAHALIVHFQKEAHSYSMSASGASSTTAG